MVLIDIYNCPHHSALLSFNPCDQASAYFARGGNPVGVLYYVTVTQTNLRALGLIDIENYKRYLKLESAGA